jgi:hypothetical protein
MDKMELEPASALCLQTCPAATGVAASAATLGGWARRNQATPADKTLSILFLYQYRPAHGARAIITSAGAMFADAGRPGHRGPTLIACPSSTSNPRA